jgi:hypothetical protein
MPLNSASKMTTGIHTEGDALIKKIVVFKPGFSRSRILGGKGATYKCNKTLQLPLKCDRALAAQSIFLTLPAVSPVSFDILQMIKVRMTSSKMIFIWVNFCQKNFS